MNNFEYNKAIAASDILTTNEAILAYSIGNYYNWQTNEPAFPTEETLAKDCKMSVRSVRRALKGLVDKGFMTYKRQYNKPNLYTPVLSMRSDSPFNEDTSGLLKDNIKDKEKINIKTLSLKNIQGNLLPLDINSLALIKDGSPAASDLIDWFG